MKFLNLKSLSKKEISFLLLLGHQGTTLLSINFGNIPAGETLIVYTIFSFITTSIFYSNSIKLLFAKILLLSILGFGFIFLPKLSDHGIFGILPLLNGAIEFLLIKKIKLFLLFLSSFLNLLFSINFISVSNLIFFKTLIIAPYILLANEKILVKNDSAFWHIFFTSLGYYGVLALTQLVTFESSKFLYIFFQTLLYSILKIHDQFNRGLFKKNLIKSWYSFFLFLVILMSVFYFLVSSSIMISVGILLILICFIRYLAFGALIRKNDEVLS